MCGSYKPIAVDKYIVGSIYCISIPARLNADLHCVLIYIHVLWESLCSWFRCLSWWL